MVHNRTFAVLLFASASMFIAVMPLSGQKSGVERSGDYLQYALPVAAGISTLIYKNEDKPGLQFASAFGSAVLFTHGMKRILNKQRPDGGNYAFPSGHTAAAFVSAGFIQKRYGWRWGIPGYMLAAYVGWTRVDAKRHDWWDVVAGASVGIASAHLFTRNYELKNSELKVSLGMGVANLNLRF